MSLKTDTEASDSIYVNLPKPNLKNVIVNPKEFVKEMEKKASEVIHKTRDEDISEKVGEDDATDVYTNEMKKKYNM